MSDICIVDTSVYCALLRVPNMEQQSEIALANLEDLVNRGDRLLLPLATVYETGNHIAQQGDGTLRRKTAERFCKQVRDALTGNNPFQPTQIHQIDEMVSWLDNFPDLAMRGIGLGDLSIIKIFEQQCMLNRGRRVYIWSYDADLDGYDRAP